MKKATIITIVLLFIASPGFAQSGEKKGSFDASALSELRMFVDAGMEITVKPSPSNSIHYVYSFDGNDQAYEHYFENFDPDYEKNGGRAQLGIEFPRQDRGHSEFKIKKHELSLLIPPSVMIDLSSRYSKIEIVGFDHGLSVQNRSGLVKVDNIDQNVVISNEYGAVTATNINGELMISNRSANVDVRNVTGPVTVNAEYSKLNISKIEGDLTTSNRSGVMNAFDIMGSLKADGPYMEYELTNIDGDVRISNKSGKVVVQTARSLIVNGDYTHITANGIKRDTRAVEIEGRSASIDLDNIAGDVMISGQYLNAHLTKIGGFAMIRNRSGEIMIEDIEKKVTISGEYLEIDLKKFKGDYLEIYNKSQGINIEALNALKSVTIENQYGDIELTMKAPFEGNVNIENEYGKFDSNLSLWNQQVNRGTNDLTISGTAGSGDGQMIIKNKNGDIKINQE